MNIRSSSKAIVLQDNKVLLNQSRREGSGVYFVLPGGGQNQYETMEEAVIRECLEETGYTVRPEALVAVHEEIYTNRDFRDHHPDHSHKIFHIFRCSLENTKRTEPTEQDASQTGCVWIDLADVPKLRLYPARVRERFMELVTADRPLYLGSSEVTF